MLHRANDRGAHAPNAGRLSDRSSPPSRVLIAVAPPPRISNPTRWGWPHWLAPAYKAGGHHSTHRPLEDYA